MSARAELRTFALGGVHPPGRKAPAAGLAIEALPPPPEYVVPLLQHFGAPASALVKKGESVAEGQCIGRVEKGLGASVHSPCAGKVAGLVRTPHPILGLVPAVAIEPDPEAPPFAPLPVDWESMDPCELLGRIKEAGVVGMGGAGFPTHVKLCPPPDLAVDTFIANGVECESYLAADHRLMLERAGDVVQGVRVILRVLGVSRGLIGVEANKPDAIAALIAAVEAAGETERISVEPLAVKYPQGSEKQLIAALTGRCAPAGGLPAHVGCVVQNVGTCVAAYEAAALGRPCTERVVTVAGAGVARPANLLCRVGTSLQHMVDHLGGATDQAVKCVLGGPMMGLAVQSLDYRVTKATSGVLLLTAAETGDGGYGPCIRCGRCLDACPMGLEPRDISIYAERGRYQDTPRFGLWDCFECGSCAYVCPAGRPLVQFIRASKVRLRCRG
ncbi:MAG: electron transport complex subunit RsxC [Thermodesulfobacteriota bacterium]